MKKLLTALLVVAMILSFSSVAFASSFSDTADLGQEAKASIAKLNALNVINGYPDGTFKPANNITRAEFAKIACIAGGMGKSADMLQSSPSKFSDVAAGQWYTGYINLSNSQGWVKGYPDGTFRPNAQITYAEVITVLVRLLGYNDNLPGPWPVDYIAKAGALDITEDVSFDANAPATRADVAIMTDATLDSEVVKWDNDTEDFEKQGYTLLEDAFETAVNDDYLVTETKYDKGVWSIKVEGMDENDLDGWLDLNEAWVASDGSIVTWLDNKLVDILYNEDDEEILFLEVTSRNITVDGEDWSYDEDDEEFEIDGTKYDRADYFVGDELAGDDEYDGDAYYRAFINSDDEVFKVGKRPATTPAIVESFEDDELTVKDEGNYGDNDTLADIDFEDDDVLIEKAGKFVEASELAENDVLYVTEDFFGYDYYIEVAGSISKTGTLEAVKGGSLKIDGTWYDVAAYNLLSDDEGEDFDLAINSSNLEDSDDEVITYFLNKSFQVCFVITGEVGSSSKIYGVVTDLSYKVTRDGNMVNEIKVLKADGTETNYDVDTDEVEIYQADLDLDEFIKFSVNEDNEIEVLTVLAQLDDEVVDNVYEVVVPYIADEDYYDEENEDYILDIQDGNDDNSRIKVSGTWYTLNDSTVIFNAGRAIDDDAEIVDKDDLIDWAMDLDADVTAYVQYAGTKVEYIYLNDDVTSATAVDFALVMDLYSKGGDDWVELDVKGDEKNYEVKGNAPVEYAIYDYAISSSKFATASSSLVFNPESVLAGTYYEVIDVDRTGNAVQIEDGTWLYADEDTVIYDYTDYYGVDNDDPAYVSGVRGISDGDLLFYVEDEDDVVDLFVIVTGVNL